MCAVRGLVGKYSVPALRKVVWGGCQPVREVWWSWSFQSLGADDVASAHPCLAGKAEVHQQNSNSVSVGCQPAAPKFVVGAECQFVPSIELCTASGPAGRNSIFQAKLGKGVSVDRAGYQSLCPPARRLREAGV